MFKKLSEAIKNPLYLLLIFGAFFNLFLGEPVVGFGVFAMLVVVLAFEISLPRTEP